MKGEGEGGEWTDQMCGHGPACVQVLGTKSDCSKPKYGHNPMETVHM